MLWRPQIDANYPQEANTVVRLHSSARMRHLLH